MNLDDTLLAILILLAALLYSSVGHGGASGYLAAMALLGVAPAVMKPVALVLNILVAALGTFKFARAGAFSWSLWWPFALASIPFAYLGGRLTLPAQFYKPLVGIVLLYTAWVAWRSAHAKVVAAPRAAPLLPRLLAGAGLGLLSGLTGVGGGIFLSPLLLLMRWAEVRIISGVAAAFILVNSIAGLLGVLSTPVGLPAALPWWALAAVAGGWVGAEYGSRRLGNATIRKLLALVLAIAGAKMIVTA